jgi:hypothetical protein
VKGKVAEKKRNSKLFFGSMDNIHATVTFNVESRQIIINIIYYKISPFKKGEILFLEV